jgi:hypothetical protein
MAKGIAIHIGLNSVDPSCYEGWAGTLVACEKDAHDMANISRVQGYTSTMLLTPDATAKNVKDAIESAASKLVKGDILFVSYSGHGGQVEDMNDEEDDHIDETWVLYDRQLIDDELYGLWSKFAEGVRILQLSDSCHSGTVSKDVPSFLEVLPESIRHGYMAAPKPRIKEIPKELAKADSDRRRTTYAAIQAENPKSLKDAMKASGLLISGCQDKQTSEDGDENGRFTAALRRIYNDGKFKYSYLTLHKRIQALMPPWQSPNFFSTGVQSRGFEKQRPFTI